MKHYFLLPFLFIWIVGCSLEVGNEYNKRRLPVDNKSYLATQKQEKILARKSSNNELFEKKRYRFKDSERPQSYRSNRYDSRDDHPVEEDYYCEKECREDGCESYCYETEVTEDNQDYYPENSDREEVYDDRAEGAKPTSSRTVKKHTPQGEYSVKRKEHAINIRPPVRKGPQKNAIHSKQKLSKASNSERKNITHSPNEESLYNTQHNVLNNNAPHPDDEGISSLAPKVITHDDMAPQVKSSLAAASTAQKANQNTSAVKSQIESRNVQAKKQIQQNALNNKHDLSDILDDNDMNTKLSQLQEITSQEKNVQKTTPSTTTNAKVPTNKLSSLPQKTSSQEVLLALNSNSETKKTSVGESSDSNDSEIPPPAGLE